MKKIAERLARSMGYELTRRDEPPVGHPDILDEAFWRILAACQPYTMTSTERVWAMYQGLGFIARQGIPGAIVECGVWRGGSMMAAALTLEHLGDTTREIYLYDTYEGMSEPTTRDVNRINRAAARKWRKHQRDGFNAWNYVPLEEVQRNVLSTSYPAERVHFVKGKVEDTIPGVAPERIALLRLDTDFYESTRHELEHLWPRLSRGGLLIIDDYGHWRGSREATDEYFTASSDPVLLHRVDYAGRVAIKL